MPTLTDKQTIASIFSPAPFGQPELTLTENEKHILVNLLTFNVFDDVYVYTDPYSVDKFNENACTELSYQYRSEGKEETTSYKVSVDVVLGNVEIGKNSGVVEFYGKPGFKFDPEAVLIALGTKSGQIGTNDLTITVVHREMNMPNGTTPVLERDELHIYVPVK